MSIEFDCANCGMHFKVGDVMAGKRGKCKGCGAVVAIPATTNIAARKPPIGPELKTRSPQSAFPPPPLPPFAKATPQAAPAFTPAPPPRLSPKPLARLCPTCGAVLSSGAVLCVSCGHDTRTGARIASDAEGASISTRRFKPLLIAVVVGAAAITVWLGVTAVRTFMQMSETDKSGGAVMGQFAAKLQQMNSRSGQQAVQQYPIGAPPLPSAVASPLPSRAIFPLLPPPQSTPGVDVYPMTIGGAGPGLPMEVRLYLPAGRHERGSLPCVFIAPAGTRLIYGSALGDGDSPEHLPYVRAGFAVLAYELSGDVPEDGTPFTWHKAVGPVRQFMNADGGLANARNAVDFVLARVPEVDPTRLYAAGHSSAATMALDVAATDHRMRAVAAYAPVCDVMSRMAAAIVPMEQLVPGTVGMTVRASPMMHISEFQCPVFIFHADDDLNVPSIDNLIFVNRMKERGKSIRISQVPSGGHYQSMIDQGIAQGIAFFAENGAKPLPPIVSAAGFAPDQSGRTSDPTTPAIPSALPAQADAKNEVAGAGEPAQTWEPDPDQLKNLGARMNLEKYTYQEPKDFALLESKNRRVHFWRQMGHSGAIFVVSLEKRLGQDDHPSVRDVAASTAQEGSLHKVVAEGATQEAGTINGIPFANVKFVRRNPRFYYAAYDGENLIIITCSAPNDSALAECNAAARTFKIRRSK